MPVSGIMVYLSSSFQPQPVRDKNKAFFLDVTLKVSITPMIMLQPLHEYESFIHQNMQIL